MPGSSAGLGGSLSSRHILTTDAIKDRASELGFNLCGVAPAAAFPELGFFKEWIARGYAGTMGYLPRSAERRSDVRNVMPSARSVVMVAALYNSGGPYSTERRDCSASEVARYARSRDYHDVMGERLDGFVAWMKERSGDGFEARAYVDTGPVQERVFAQYAGLGWIGKNACVINAELGSWLLLGVVLCSADLECDAPATDQCGTCTLCLEACPTGAFVAPHELDATKCISYLTIEYRGSIPDVHRDRIGNHVFGCDVCQEVCPWNGSPLTTSDPSWSARADVNAQRLVQLWRHSDAELARFIGDTAMTRAGIRGLRRNLAVALGNSGDPDARTALEEIRTDETIGEPIVAEHVQWALRKLT